MSWEVFEDFGKKPMYDDFLRQSRDLRFSGWEERTFLTLIDAEDKSHRTFPYYLSKNGDLIVYDELSLTLERVVLDQHGHLLACVPLEPTPGTLGIEREEFPPEFRQQR